MKEGARKVKVRQKAPARKKSDTSATGGDSDLGVQVVTSFPDLSKLDVTVTVHQDDFNDDSPSGLYGYQHRRNPRWSTEDGAFQRHCSEVCVLWFIIVGVRLCALSIPRCFLNV